MRRKHRGLNAEQEVELSRALSRARRKALALALNAPSAGPIAAALRASMKVDADVWQHAQRTHGSEGKRLTNAEARAQLEGWCRRVEAGASSCEPGIVEGGLWLTDATRRGLFDEAHCTLSDPERVALAECLRVKRNARAEFARCNQGLVVQQATKYQYFGLLRVDLIQEGNLGLLRAIDKFDPEQGCRFSTYAIWWIRHAMRRALSNQSRTIRLPVHAYEDQLALRNALEELRSQRTGEPTEQDLVTHSGLSPERVRSLLALVGEPFSLDTSPSEEGSALGERVKDGTSPSVLTKLVHECELEALEPLLAALSEREQAMLKMRFGLQGEEAHTLHEVGEQFGVSRERVRQIINDSLARMRGRARSEFCT